MNQSEQLLFEELKNLFPGFTCTLQDLRTPSEEFVTSFYTYWLSEFEVNIAAIPQIQFSQSQIPNVSLYTDTYSSTIPKLNLLRIIRSFDVIPDFGMLDIISPTPKRTQTVIRAFCEYYQWCDDRLFSIIELKKEKKIIERKQLLAKLVKEKQNYQEMMNNNFIAIGQLQDAKKELEREYVEHKQRASELMMETKLLKSQSEKASENIEVDEAALQKLIKEESQISTMIRDYSNQVVNSPTVILTDLETLRLKEKEMKNVAEQKRDIVESKMEAQKNLQEVLSSAENNASQLEEVLKLIEHQRKLLHIMSDIEKQTVGCQEELKELTSSLRKIINKKTNCQEELQALSLKWKNMKDRLTQSLAAAESELKNQQNLKSKMSNSLKENKALEEDIRSITKQIEKHVKAFEVDYEKIVNHANARLKSLETGCLQRAEQVKVELEKKMKKKKSKK